MVDKKEAKKNYKQTLPPMGIYQIKNLADGKVLIGSSKNLPGMLNRCKFQLGVGSHMNNELQSDYQKLGEKNFSFDILDQLEPKEDPSYDYTDDLKVLEEMWLEKLQPFGEKGYNKQTVMGH